MTAHEKLAAAIGTWGAPPDGTAKVALVLALGFGLGAFFDKVDLLGREPPHRGTAAEDEARTSRRIFLAATAFGAALLSLAYIAFYLRGGPRIVDAGTYFLQGRALSHGDLAWTPLEPTASFRGRFLTYRDGSVSGIFPPGYPLVLAIGFFLGAPMLVGPILAAMLVVATYRLAREVVASSPAVAPVELHEPIARTAVLFSVVCGALRYHTADTMSHGATALGITLALALALRSRRDARRRVVLGIGLALGFVVATRPVSAIAVGIVTLAIVGSDLLAKPGGTAEPRRGIDTLRSNRRALALVALGAVPGIVLLLCAQRAATGSFFASTQRAYYALADGPTGCFRWGFGANTGCLHEHGDFVHARLPNGYGLVAALGTTLRRLHVHLLDVANLEPLALLVLLPFLKRSRTRTALALGSVVLLHVVAYAPFYFDGNYPGGGARFFADVLPIEHVLLALGIGAVARGGRDRIRFGRFAFASLAVATGGFAVHAAYAHGKLRDRDGGQPLYEPDALARSHVKTGLVFVDTDQAFSLGHDPAARIEDGIVVARFRDDARDRMLYEALRRPPTYLYKQPPEGAPPSASPAIPWAPPEITGAYTFEAEAEWPPLDQANGFAVPGFTDPCASKGQALVVTPDATDAEASIEVPVPPVPEGSSTRTWSVSVRIVRGAQIPHAPPPPPSTGLGEGEASLGAAHFRWIDAASSPRCEDLPPQIVELTPPRAVLRIRAHGAVVAVDQITLSPPRKAPRLRD